MIENVKKICIEHNNKFNNNYSIEENFIQLKEKIENELNNKIKNESNNEKFISLFNNKNEINLNCELEFLIENVENNHKTVENNHKNFKYKYLKYKEKYYNLKKNIIK